MQKKKELKANIYSIYSKYFFNNHIADYPDSYYELQMDGEQTRVHTCIREHWYGRLRESDFRRLIFQTATRWNAAQEIPSGKYRGACECVQGLSCRQYLFSFGFIKNKKVVLVLTVSFILMLK